MAALTYAPCPSCGAVNRFAAPEGSKTPVCGKCKRALPFHDGVLDVDAAGLEKLVQKSPIPVVTDFWAAWCGPCRFFAPVFSAVAKDRFGSAVFAKVDTERAPEAGRKYGISAIPTLVVFHHGRELHRQSGALPEPAFRKLLADVVHA